MATAPFSARSLGIEDTQHYAAFPPEMVRPMVRAATSERGVCARCGAPWRRVVERAARPGHPVSAVRVTPMGPHKKKGGQYQKWLDGHPPQTTGWQPTCPCDAGDAVPATVLDPFCGSGTTGLVCVQEGRGFIGIDLNPAYIALSRARIATAQPALFTASEASQAAV